MDETYVQTVGVEVMNKDRIAGSAKEIKGSVKETIGNATGDSKSLTRNRHG
jgi:hypothetical protein